MGEDKEVEQDGKIKTDYRNLFVHILEKIQIQIRHSKYLCKRLNPKAG